VKDLCYMTNRGYPELVSGSVPAKGRPAPNVLNATNVF
jgi:hypothetical protein